MMAVHPLKRYLRLLTKLRKKAELSGTNTGLTRK